MIDNILQLHKARAEYFILNGVYDKAILQLKLALDKAQGSFRDSAIVKERLKQIHALREQARKQR